MSIKQFILAIHKLYPNVEYTSGHVAYDIDGNVVEYDESLINAEIESNQYKDLRAVEYPPVTEQLDALWKGGEAAADMLAQIQAVKNKYPKPE